MSSNCVNGGMFPDKPTKNIKFTSNGIGGCKLVVTEGSDIVASIDTCKWETDYEQFFTTSMFLKKHTNDVAIQYGNLGTQITFIAIFVEYELAIPSSKPPLTDPYLTYIFETDVDVVRPINKIFIHSGTKDQRIPKIFLSNPSQEWNARISILASTEELTFDEVTSNPIGDSVITFENLEYTNLESDGQGLSILDNNNETLIFIVWQNISNIELNGKIITIDDSAVGRVNLSFKTDFDSQQAYSLILWSMSDPSVNIIVAPASADLISPVITYNGSFTTEILLEDYPRGGTNGTAGIGDDLITKDDLITLQINEVNDDRDGLIILDANNISLSLVGSTTEIDAITEIGKYNFIIDVCDNANNCTTDSFILNVKDEMPPQIILNSFGIQILNENGTNGTFGQSTNVYLEDYSSDTIEQQDILNLLIDSIYDTRDGDILNHINNVVTTINEVGSNVLLTEIDGIGNYEIRFQVPDSDGNIGEDFYSVIDSALNRDFIRLQISENQAPEIFFNNYTPLFLSGYSGQTLTKTDLNILAIDQVTDDRDGIITTDVLNIRIFQNGIPAASAGTSSVFVLYSTAGTSGEFFDPISEVELISIVDKGQYFVKVSVTDSDGANTTEDDEFTVFD